MICIEWGILMDAPPRFGGNGPFPVIRDAGSSPAGALRGWTWLRLSLILLIEIPFELI